MSHIGTNSVWKSVSPHDCALGVALPWSREEFLSDQDDPAFDFVKTMCDTPQLRLLNRESQWKFYENSLLTTVQRLCDDIEQLGVHVQRGIKLDDLTKLFQTYEVVIPICHFKLLTISAAEIYDVEKFEKAVMNGQRYADRAIQQILHKIQHNPRQGAAEERAAILAKELSNRFSITHRWYDPFAENDELKPVRGENAETLEFRLTRELVEMEYPDSIQNGRVVELRNGLVTLREMRERISDQFAGILDFSCCNAILPSRVMKSCGGNFNVIGRVLPAYPIPLLIRIKAVMRSLSIEPRPYVDALDDYDKAVRRVASRNSSRFRNWIRNWLFKN